MDDRDLADPSEWNVSDDVPSFMREPTPLSLTDSIGCAVTFPAMALGAYLMYTKIMPGTEEFANDLPFFLNDSILAARTIKGISSGLLGILGGVAVGYIAKGASTAVREIYHSIRDLKR